MLEGWKGKSILVAGATGGLGREVCRMLSRIDCSLVLVHQSESERLAKLKAELRGGNAHVSYYPCDFTRADEINDTMDVFFDQERQPYALINLIGDPARVDWQKAQISHMQDSFLKNASAPLHSAKEFGLRMRAKSLPGAIILFSSMQGLYPFEGSLYYGTAKGALIHGAKILAKEFGGNPFIRVNVIAPGVNEAGMAEESIRKGKYRKFLDKNIIPSYGSPSQIATLIAYLLEPDLYMTGECLLFDGGMTLRRDLS